MKNIIIYLACSVAFFIGIALMLSGGLWSLAGLVWFFGMYVSGEYFSRVWLRFWIINARILRYFDCL